MLNQLTAGSCLLRVLPAAGKGKCEFISISTTERKRLHSRSCCHPLRSAHIQFWTTLKCHPSFLALEFPKGQTKVSVATASIIQSLCWVKLASFTPLQVLFLNKPSASKSPSQILFPREHHRKNLIPQENSNKKVAMTYSVW